MTRRGSPQVKELAIGTLADICAAQGDAEALRRLLTELRPLFGAVPKAKTAKIVRGIIETIARVPGSGQLQVCSSGLSGIGVHACTRMCALSHCSMLHTSLGRTKSLVASSTSKTVCVLVYLSNSMYAQSFSAGF